LVELRKLSDDLTLTLDVFVFRVKTEDTLKVVTALARTLLAQINQNAPRDTGEYAGSWQMSVIDNNRAQVFTPKGRLALILEFGTVPHRIEPKFAEVLRFEIGGEVIFAKFVDHPGTAPIPHLRRAFEFMKTNATVIAKQAVS
jgi:hypothetical protein